MTLFAAQIAEAVGAPTTAYIPRSGKLSERFNWFGNADTTRPNDVIALGRADAERHLRVVKRAAPGHPGDSPSPSA